jgi:hypothetical protein
MKNVNIIPVESETHNPILFRKNAGSVLPAFTDDYLSGHFTRFTNLCPKEVYAPIGVV